MIPFEKIIEGSEWETNMEEKQRFLGEIKEEELAAKLKGKSRSVTVVMLLLLPLIAFLGIMIKKFIDVRMTEINESISATQKVSEGNKSHHMLVNYFLISQKMKRQEESEDLYIQEAAFHITLPEIEPIVEIPDTGLWNAVDQSLDDLARWVIKGIRVFMLKSDTESVNTLYDNPELQKAYVLERNRKFDSAAEKYHQILQDEDLTDELKAYIFLHKGYCLGQMAEYKKAITDMSTIIDSYGGTAEMVDKNPFILETVDVAVKLKKILEALLHETEKIDNNKNLNDFERGKSYYFVGNYNKAISNLEKSIQTDNLHLNEAYFFLARSLEETGHSSEALEIYKKLQETEFGKNAADRIVMAATLYKDSGASEVMTGKDFSSENRNSEFIRTIESLSGKNDSTGMDGSSPSNDFYAAMQNVLNNNVQSFNMVLRNEASIDMSNPVVIEKGLQGEGGVLLNPEIISMAPPEGFSNVNPIAPPAPVMEPRVNPNRNVPAETATANNRMAARADDRFNQLQAQMNINNKSFRPLNLPFPEDREKEVIPYQLPPSTNVQVSHENMNKPEPLATHQVTIDGKTMVGIVSRELGSDYILFKPKGDDKSTLMLKRSEIIIESLSVVSQENNTEKVLSDTGDTE